MAAQAAYHGARHTHAKASALADTSERPVTSLLRQIHLAVDRDDGDILESEAGDRLPDANGGAQLGA